MKTLYLDDAATTKVRKEVAKEMEKYYLEDYGNPSSRHEMGERARKAVDNAREKLAREINAKPWELIFTSGVTEANNLALQGLARVSKRKKIIISAIEHAAIMETCSYLEKRGYKIIKIPVNKEGLLRLNILEREIDNGTLLVSVMHVNNVLGTMQDLKAIGEICKRKGVLFHTDASQSFGKLDINVKNMNIDLLSASSHKIGGPKGCGFLYVREGINISPLIFGGGQERGLRGGTENVPAIVGFSMALELMKKVNKEKIRKIRDKLIIELEKIGKINGSKTDRIYNNIHLSISGIEADTLVAFLSRHEVYVSTGSACESKREKEDHVLKAIGLNDEEIRGSIRITVNEDISEKDVSYIVNEIRRDVGKLR